MTKANFIGKIFLNNCRILFIAFPMLFCTVAKGQTHNVNDSLIADSFYKFNDMKVQKAPSKLTTATVHRRDTRPFFQRISFEMNSSFWINASSTFFEFSPVLVYKMPKVISFGAGPTYIYKRDRISRVNLHGLGGKVFSRAHLNNWFYAYTEYQGIDNQFISSIDLPNNKITRGHQYVDSWFLSLGMHIRMGKRHGVNLQALYDVLYNKTTSPYYGAWTYRIGFGF